MPYFYSYLITFFAGMLLAASLFHWKYHYHMRQKIEQWVNDHARRLKESEQAFSASLPAEGEKK